MKTTQNMTPASKELLTSLLKQRLDIIADHAFRDRDAEGHLAELRKTSEAIDAAYLSLKPHLSPRLRHFMEKASYSKALESMEHETEEI